MLDHTIYYRSFSKLNYNTLVSKFFITIKDNFQKVYTYQPNYIINKRYLKINYILHAVEKAWKFI
jgi:hypothetical protein